MRKHALPEQGRLVPTKIIFSISNFSSVPHFAAHSPHSCALILPCVTSSVTGHFDRVNHTHRSVDLVEVVPLQSRFIDGNSFCFFFCGRFVSEESTGAQALNSTSSTCEEVALVLFVFNSSLILRNSIFRGLYHNPLHETHYSIQPIKSAESKFRSYNLQIILPTRTSKALSSTCMCALRSR